MRRRTQKRRAVSLVEVLVYAALVVLILSGATLALVGTLQNAQRIGAHGDRVRESSRVERRFLISVGDASSVLVAGSSGSRKWPSLLWGSSQFVTSLGQGQNASTGFIATLPHRYALTYRRPDGSLSTLPIGDQPFQREGVGSACLVYRGDERGRPDSSAGTRLWLIRTNSLQTLLRPQLLTDKLSGARDAVDFREDGEGLLRVELHLSDVALAPNETNPIRFGVRLDNHSANTDVLADRFLGTAL